MQPLFFLFVWLCALGIQQAWAAPSNTELTYYARQMEQYAAAPTGQYSYSQSAPAPGALTQGSTEATLRSTLSPLSIPHTSSASSTLSSAFTPSMMQSSFSEPVREMDPDLPFLNPAFVELMKMRHVPSISVTSTPIDPPSSQTGHQLVPAVADEHLLHAPANFGAPLTSFSSAGQTPLVQTMPQQHGMLDMAMDLDVPQVALQSSVPLVQAPAGFASIYAPPPAVVSQVGSVYAQAVPHDMANAQPPAVVSQVGPVYAQAVPHDMADALAAQNYATVGLSVPLSRDASQAGSMPAESPRPATAMAARWLTESSLHGAMTSPGSFDESFVTSYFPPVAPASVQSSVALDHHSPSEESSGQLSAFEQLRVAPWQSVPMEGQRSNVALSSTSSRPALGRRTSGTSATSHVSSSSARYSPYPRSVMGSFSTASSSVPHLAMTRADETLQDTPTMASMSFAQQQAPQRASTLDAALNIPTQRASRSESTNAKLVQVDLDPALDLASGRRCERCHWVFGSTGALQQHFMHHLIIESAWNNAHYGQCAEGSRGEKVLEEQHDLQNVSPKRVMNHSAKSAEAQRYAAARDLIGKVNGSFRMARKSKSRKPVSVLAPSPTRLHPSVGSASVLQSFTCRTCNDTLSGSEAIQNHYKKHLDASEAEVRLLTKHHRCTWCNASLANLPTAHRCTKEPKAYRQAVEQQRLARISAPASQITDPAASNSTVLERREKNLETVAKRLSGKFVSIRTKDGETLAAPERHITCSRCNSRFPSIAGLTAHTAKHEQFDKGEWKPATTYRCKLCDKRFAYRGETHAHECPKVASSASSSNRSWYMLRRRFDASQFESIKHGLKK